MRFVSLGFNIYLSNKLGSETIGIFTLIMSVYLFFLTIATSGLSMAITCIVSEELEKRNRNVAFQTLRTSMLMSLIFGIIAGSLIIIFSNFIISICLHNIEDQLDSDDYKIL